MFADKQKVLYDAQMALNNPNQPWYVTIEGDAIVARWKWMDAVFFSPHEVNQETREFTFVVTLKDNGKWKEIDHSTASSAGVGFQNGNLTFGGANSSFSGHSTQKSFSLGSGINRQNGEVGLIAVKFDSSLIKNAVRAFLTNYGWKRAGFFG